jgi:hypothetical protein
MSIPSLFFRTAILLAIAGILLFIFGGYYALAPQAAEGVLPKVHYTLCLIGLLVFMSGLTGIGLGNDLALAPLAAIGSLLLLAGFLAFAVIIFRTRIAPKAAA